MFLENFLNNIISSVPTETDELPMDYISAHGYLTGLCVVFDDIHYQKSLCYILANQEISQQDTTTLKNDIEQKCTAIKSQLSDESEYLDIPVSNDGDDANDNCDIANWCTGFMEAQFQNIDSHNDNAQLAEIMLPVIVLSGMFDDETEIAEILNDDKLIEEMIENLPDTIVDMYLFFKVESTQPTP